jgi:hypothetical protein
MEKKYLLVLFVSSLIYSAPSISGVSDTISDGETVVIAGTGFTSKSPAKPLLWADFATDINPSSLGTRTEWDIIQDLNRTTELPTGAGTSNGVYGEWGGPNHWSHSFSVAMPGDGVYYSKVYTFGKRYYTFPTTSNYKVWRLNPPLDCSLQDGCGDPILNYNSSSPWFAHLNECDDNPDRFTNENGYNSYIEDVWQTEEVIWQYDGGSGLYYNSSPAAGSGIFAYWINGVRIFRQESIDNCLPQYVDLRMFDNFTAQNTPTDTPDPGERVYMTLMYADTVYNRVIIGNDSIYDSCTQREIAIPSAWGATEVSVTLVQGTFSNGDTGYVFVIDSTDTASTGYQIIFGATGSSNYHASAVDTVFQTDSAQVRDTTSWVVGSGIWPASHWLISLSALSETDTIWHDSAIDLAAGTKTILRGATGGRHAKTLSTTGSMRSSKW